MRPNLVIADQHDFAEVAAGEILKAVEAAVLRANRCSLALTGGNTPRPVYELLGHGESARHMPWMKLDLYFSDERCVPPDDPASNYAMALDSMLKGGPGTAARVYRIPAERADRDQAALEYEMLMPQRLDVLLLGMGTNGHTASLFPGSTALDETTRRLLAVKCPATPPWRITVTPPVIEQAESVIVLISGKAKAAAAARAIKGEFDPKAVPAQLALRGTWILDDEAAAEI